MRVMSWRIRPRGVSLEETANVSQAILGMATIRVSKLTNVLQCLITATCTLCAITLMQVLSVSAGRGTMAKEWQIALLVLMMPRRHLEVSLGATAHVMQGLWGLAPNRVAMLMSALSERTCVLLSRCVRIRTEVFSVTALLAISGMEPFVLRARKILLVPIAVALLWRITIRLVQDPLTFYSALPLRWRRKIHRLLFFSRPRSPYLILTRVPPYLP
eukprot:Rmarinus@m.9374